MKEALSGLIDTRTMFIALYNPETAQIEFPLWYQTGDRIPELDKVAGKPWGPRKLGERQGLTDWVIRHRQPLLIERDFEARASSLHGVEVYPIGTKCWLGVPMLLRDKLIGVIAVQNYEQEGVYDYGHKVC